jgi:hypothetical protein
VKLVPLQPPGRITRKAREFEADIVQLRAQGYTFNAIRQALAAAGVDVGITTVRREVLRGAAVPLIATATVAATATATATATAAGANAQGVMPSISSREATPIATSSEGIGTLAPTHWGHGRDVAEAFTRNRITNPLIRAKEQR